MTTVKGVKAALEQGAANPNQIDRETAALAMRTPAAPDFAALREGCALLGEALIEGRSTPAIIIRSDGVVRAFLNRCPHAGWPLDTFDGRFIFAGDGSLICAAHGALFDPVTGACRGGPGTGAGLIPVDLAAVSLPEL